MSDPGLKPSAGSRAFAAIVRRLGAAEVARALKKSPGAVHNWSTGRRSPTPGARKEISKRYPVSSSAWAEPPAATTPSRARPHTDRPPTVARPGPELAPAGARARPARALRPPASDPDLNTNDPQAVCRDTVRRLRAELDRLDGDELATSRERASVSSALTSATRLLARLSGVLELTPSQILRSPSWRALEGALVAALRPIPGACEAAAKALREFGGEP